MGLRAEYIRKGTKWDQIERNREEMIKICPNTDFYVSATVSLYNAIHIVDFHRDWVEKGFLKPADWNINILQHPDRERIDVLPQIYKDQIKEKIEEHIAWLEPQDHLRRAVSGYQGIINFMQHDRSRLLNEFFKINDKSDAYRNEIFEDVFPEYINLRYYSNLRDSITEQEFKHFEQALELKIKAAVDSKLETKFGEFIAKLHDDNGQHYAHMIYQHVKKWV